MIDIPRTFEEATFLESLTQTERTAGVKWFNLGHEQLREYQLNGASSPGIVDFDREFAAVLRKAPPYQGTVWRGLSANRYRPGSIEFLQEILNEPAHTLGCHSSASRSQQEGYGFCKLGNAETELAVLLVVRTLSGRCLDPIRHEAGSEDEIILTRSSHYSRRQRCGPWHIRAGLEFWIVGLDEVATL